MFQSFALYPWLTVQENVQVGLIQRRLDARLEEEEIRVALELIGLSGYENAYPKQLSGGRICLRNSEPKSGRSSLNVTWPMNGFRTPKSI